MLRSANLMMMLIRSWGLEANSVVVRLFWCVVVLIVMGKKFDSGREDNWRNIDILIS